MIEAVEEGPFRQFWECAKNAEFKKITFPSKLRVERLEAGRVLHRFGRPEFAVITGLKFGRMDVNIIDLDF